MLFTGTSLHDNFTGTANADTFNMAQGGSDKVSGAGGNDTFNFGAELDADDQIDGGDGNDTLNLNGDYSAGLIFNATTIASVENIHLAAGNDYSLQFVVVPAGDTLTLDATALGAGNSVNFGGGSGIGKYILHGGAGDDVLVGGAGNDVITGGDGGDTINPNAGNDIVHAGAGQDFIEYISDGTFNVNDTLDGGDDFDFLNIFGNSNPQTYVFKPTTIQNIENLTVGSTSFNITLDDANVAANAILDVSGASLTASQRLIVDGSHETDGHLTFLGGVGNDKLTGGKQFDTFLGGDGKDVMAGRGGTDSFQYHQLSESTGTHYDTIIGFNSAEDSFFFDVAVNKIETPIKTGSLSTATFNSDLHALGTHPGAGHAVLFEPDAGTLAGKVFLIVDANGQAGYQANADFVIELLNPIKLALTTFNFHLGG
jgi:Ca2+-binding RTX toxin-like protein